MPKGVLSDQPQSLLFNVSSAVRSRFPMPRKSQAALTAPVVPRVDGRPHRLPAPADLSAAAREVWTAIVASVGVDHFRASDSPLLRSYAEITATADLAAHELATKGAVIGGKVSPWLNIQERACRVQVALAQKLRLCPAARSDPKTIGRQTPPASARVDFSRLRR